MYFGYLRINCRFVFSSILCVLCNFNEILLWIILWLFNYLDNGFFGKSVLILFINFYRFSLRKGCINPAIGFAMQTIMAFKTGNFLLIAYSLPVIIGPTVGAVLAYYAFFKFYNPLLEDMT
jgi:hypothetical protein